MRDIHTGVILDERFEVSLQQLCDSLQVSETWVYELVIEGALEPTGDKPAQWGFDAEALRRMRTARRLHRDLGLNAAGIALTLDLLEELQRLRAQLR